MASSWLLQAVVAVAMASRTCLDKSWRLCRLKVFKSTTVPPHSANLQKHGSQGMVCNG